MPTAQLLGTYRKSHIPDGPGYHEKYYFTPGDTGFRVWDTRFGRSASASAGTSGSRSRRARMALLGAEILLYPTAIGSEPPAIRHRLARSLAARDAGPRGGNLMPVVAANRDRRRARRALAR